MRKPSCAVSPKVYRESFAPTDSGRRCQSCKKRGTRTSCRPLAGNHHRYGSHCWYCRSQKYTSYSSPRMVVTAGGGLRTRHTRALSNSATILSARTFRGRVRTQAKTAADVQQPLCPQSAACAVRRTTSWTSTCHKRRLHVNVQPTRVRNKHVRPLPGPAECSGHISNARTNAAHAP